MFVGGENEKRLNEKEGKRYRENMKGERTGRRKLKEEGEEGEITSSSAGLVGRVAVSFHGFSESSYLSIETQRPFWRSAADIASPVLSNDCVKGDFVKCVAFARCTQTLAVKPGYFASSVSSLCRLVFLFTASYSNVSRELGEYQPVGTVT